MNYGDREIYDNRSYRNHRHRRRPPVAEKEPNQDVLDEEATIQEVFDRFVAFTIELIGDKTNYKNPDMLCQIRENVKVIVGIDEE